MKKTIFTIFSKPQWFLYLGLLLLYFAQVGGTPWVSMSVIAALFIIAAPVLAWFFLRDEKQTRKNVLLLSGLTLLAILFYVAQHELLWRPSKPDQNANVREQVESVRFFLRVIFLILLFTIMFFATLFELSRYRNQKDRSTFVRRRVFSTLSLVIFLVLLNIAGGLRPFMADLTFLRRFSLSTQGRELVSSIPVAIKITAFYPFFHDYHREIELFLRDVSQTNPLISYSMHDAIREKQIADKNKVDRNGWLVIEAKDQNGVELATRDKTRRLSFTTSEQLQNLEADVLSALLATAGPRRTIYFTVGHGEPSEIAFTQDESVSRFTEQLKRNNYEIKYLTPQTGYPLQIPNDAAVIAIIGAKQNFSQKEINLLREYAKQKGKFLIALDRNGANLDWLLSQNGLSFNKAPALSMVALKPNTNNLICTQYADHPLSRHLLSISESERFSFFPDSGSLSSSIRENTNVDFFVLSDSRTWIDTNQNKKHDRQSEPMGTKNIAAAVTIDHDSKNERQSVVFASSEFLKNRYITYGQNMYLAVNSFNWLNEDSRILGLVPPRGMDKPVRVSPAHENMLFYGLALVWPGIILLIGFIVSRRASTRKRAS